jgi:hypothetical protein
VRRGEDAAQRDEQQLVDNFVDGWWCRLIDQLLDDTADHPEHRGRGEVGVDLPQQLDLGADLEGTVQQIADLAEELIEPLGGFGVGRVPGREQHDRERAIPDDVLERLDDLLAQLNLRRSGFRIVDLDPMDPPATRTGVCFVDESRARRTPSDTDWPKDGRFV